MQHAHPNPPIARRMRRTRWSFVAWGMALTLSGVTAACHGAPTGTPTVANVPSAQESVSAPEGSSASVSTPAAAPSVRASTPASKPTARDTGSAATLSGPPTGLTAPAPGEQRLSGTVIEHLPAGSYHYMRIAPEHGEPRWVVTMGGEYHEGAVVEVSNFGARRDFYSRRLDRRFAELVFGMVDVVG